MATALERQIIAEANRRHVRKLVAQRGWTEVLEARAKAIFAELVSWEGRYSAAYENGHNVRHLSGTNLGHYAHCYADICDETGIDMTFESFWISWEAGDAFEGTPDGNWHCVW
jgi:hypothetical protein